MQNLFFNFERKSSNLTATLILATVLSTATFGAPAKAESDNICPPEVCVKIFNKDERYNLSNHYETLGQAAYARTVAQNRLFDYQEKLTHSTTSLADTEVAIEMARAELEEAEQNLRNIQSAVMLSMFGHVIDKMTLAAELLVITEYELNEAYEVSNATAIERNTAEDLLLEHCLHNPDNQVCQSDDFKLIQENYEKHDK